MLQSRNFLCKLTQSVRKIGKKLKDTRFLQCTGEVANYTNWQPNQPDNARGNEDCAAFTGRPQLE